MEKKTSTEIHNCIGIPINKVSLYSQNNHKFNHIYAIKEASNELVKEKQIPKELLDEWDSVIAMFRRKGIV